MIFRLNDTDNIFPDPALAEPDGLLATGGDLSPQRLMAAYRQGIFPWFSENEPVCWYAPHGRCVLYPQKIVVSKSMQRILKKGIFSVTVNTAFNEVIGACKSTFRPGQDGTWITGEMEAAYIQLHKMGIAKSIEVWKDGTLAGGMYGLEINNIFCGESMFSNVANASKLALIFLCRQSNYSIIDCQVKTEHLLSMGAQMISQNEFLRILRKSP